MCRRRRALVQFVFKTAPKSLAKGFQSLTLILYSCSGFFVPDE